MSGNNRPWDFDQSREACRAASKAQAQGEEEIKLSAREAAQADERYRVALAKRIVELRAEGEPATLCETLARGTAAVANLKMLAAIAEGVYKAMEHAAWRHNQDRKDAQRFSDWSMRRELAEAGPGAEQPSWRDAA